MRPPSFSLAKERCVPNQPFAAGSPMVKESRGKEACVLIRIARYHRTAHKAFAFEYKDP